MATKKYTRELILYKANQEMLFNVSIDEHMSRRAGFSLTTLEELVITLVKHGLLVEKARDDSDIYYATTVTGEIELLRLQIKYRQGKGKDVLDLLEVRTYLQSTIT